MGDEKKKGPVRPPVIDLTARPAGARTARADTPKRPPTRPPKKSGKTSSPPPSPSPAGPKSPGTTRRKSLVLPLGLTALIGAVGGLVLAFGLATMGLWPMEQPDPIDLTTPALAGLNARIDALERGLPALQDRFADAREFADLEARMAALVQSVGTDVTARADLSDLGARIETLASKPPAGFDDLTARLTRLENAQNAPPPAAATPPAPGETERARQDRLSADFAALSDRVSQIAGTSEAANAATSSQVATLERELAALAARLGVLDEPARLARIEAGRQAGFDAIMRLEEKMLGGVAFAEELRAVTSRLPALRVADMLEARATTGLATVEGLRASLVGRMPDILRALASEKTDASLLERLGDQLAAMVALRPDGTPEGDTAIAGLARLETALERGEVITANTGFLALPEVARRAAGSFGTQLNDTAAAAEWIGLARAMVAASAGAPT